MRGGVFTFVMLALLQGFGEIENATLSVLAPNIRDTFHVSDGVIVFITAASGAFLALGALPMGWLADRFRRAPVIGWATAVFSVMVFACGFAVNAFALFVARFGAGFAKSNTYPVQGSLIADTYPIAVRGRVERDHRRRGPPGRGAEPRDRRRHRRARRRPRRLALGVLRAGLADDPAGDLRVPHARAAARSARDARRARRSRRRPRRDSDAARGRARPPQPDPHVQDDAARLRGAGLRSVHRAGAAEPVPRSPLPRRHVRPRRRRDRDGRGRARRAAVRREALRRAVPARPGPGAADDRPVDPADRGAPPDPVLHAQRDALRDRRDRAGRAAPQRVHHGRSDHPVGRAPPPARSRASRSARSTCSSSAPPAAPSSPRCSPARSGRAARCCWSAFPRRSSAGC